MAVASGVAFAAVTAEIYAATNAAREEIKIHNQLNAVLKSTGGIAGVTAEAAIELADAMQQVTNFDNEAVLSAENLLLTFTKISKDIFPDATEIVLDMSTALGQDLKSSAIQLGKALQDPILGVTALRRVGVSFSESQVEFIQSLVDSGKQLEAQQYILKELQTEFGGSARAAADPVIQLTNAIGDMQEEIGKALIPVLIDVINAIKPVVEHVTRWVQEHPKLTAAILGGTAVLLGLITALATLGIVLAGLVPVAAALGVTVLALFGWMALIPLAIAAIIAGGYLLITHWEAVKQKVTEFIEQHRLLIGLLSFLYPAGAVTVALVKGILWLVQHWDLIVQKVAEVVGVFQALIDIYKQVADLAAKPINFVINAVGGGSGSSIGKSMISSALRTITPFATGGIVTSPTLALIGEAGPEAVVPLSGSRGRGLAGVGGVVVNINGGVYLSEDVAADLGDMIIKKLKLSLAI